MSAGEKQVFARAAELIRTIGHCKGSFARNELGLPIWNWTNELEHFSGFCMSGAVRRATYEMGINGDQALETLRREVRMWPAAFNDTHTETEVLAALDRLAA